MGKFNKPSRAFSDRKKPDYKKTSDRSFKKDDSEKDEKKGGYKAKRSFSKNKELRKSPGFKSRSKYGFSDKFKKDDSFKEKRPYGTGKNFKKEGYSDEDRSFKRNDKYADKEKKFSRSGDKPERFGKDRDFKKKPYDRERRSDDGEKKFSRSHDKSERFGKDKDFKEKRPYNREEKSGAESERRFTRSSEKPERFSKDRDFKEKRSYDRDEKRGSNRDSGEKRVKYDEFEEGRSFSKGYKKEYTKEKKSPTKSKPNPDGLTRLNKYLANAGIASRREADTLIKSGVVKVNGVPVTEMGFKVKPGDTVTYGDSAVKSERKVYLLLNKPKDYITTVDDPQERKTVMDLIEDACKERVYPVGRLDRNTTGLLLFTNDGELTKKLTHPKHEIKKVYHVSLNKGLKPEDFKSIIEGIELEDGMIKADDLAFVGEGKKEIGIEIHSGRNRIVRRIFEHLGYDVLKLDRVVFAGLTKKDLPRGKYRFLTAKEVNFLQMIG